LDKGHPFPTDHSRLYSHGSTYVGPGGEAGGGCAAKVRCIMASSNSGDISEVKFLTVAEVAAVMRVSKMTVYRLVHSGELPAVRVGRSFRVQEDAVNEYLHKSFFQTG
jgi:excisionase family DNA binding protein